MNIALKQLITSALQEDIGAGDFSTISCIPATETGKAVLKVKDKGILAGMQVAQQIFWHIQPDCLFVPFMKDGDIMQPGQIAFEITAKVHTILAAERLVLNTMQRMSGIATLTNSYVAMLQGYHTKILDTRKTTPNFRLLEKEAVKIGGAINHRFGLYDMIMLKDNHIDYAGGIVNAINNAHNYVTTHNLNIRIEVETRSLADVALVLATCKQKVFRIMLDNFTPMQVAEAVALINKEVETEASGGINKNSILQYAATNVDYVSIGSLIHQAQSVDLSLKAI